MTAPPCATGCTTRGQHRPDCDNTCPHKRTARTCPTRCDGTCRGCLPRPAEHGHLCPWCWQRLQSDIATAPALIRHLRTMAQPTAGARPSDNAGGGGDPAFGTILSAAVDAADELHACLASWAHLVLEEHPDGPQMRGPDETLTVRTSTVAVLDSDIAREYGPYLRRSTVEGIRHAQATVRLVAWLMPWLDWCAEQEWAGEMRREVASMTATTLARWPMGDTRTRPVPGVACPRCSLVGLTYTPPSWERQPFVVACSNPECGRVFAEDEWTRLVELLGLAERRLGA